MQIKIRDIEYMFLLKDRKFTGTEYRYGVLQCCYWTALVLVPHKHGAEVQRK